MTDINCKRVAGTSTGFEKSLNFETKSTEEYIKMIGRDKKGLGFRSFAYITKGAIADARTSICMDYQNFLMKKGLMPIRSS